MLEKFNRKENLNLVQDRMKRNLTVALFFETEDGRTEYKPVWYLKDWKEVYLELCDPTEYSTAIYLIGDWNHWQMLVKSWAVGPYIKEWREELKIKLRSQAIENLKKQAATKMGTSAARWLAENGYEGKLPKIKKAQAEAEEISGAEILQHSKRMGVA